MRSPLAVTTFGSADTTAPAPSSGKPLVKRRRLGLTDTTLPSLNAGFLTPSTALTPLLGVTAGVKEMGESTKLKVSHLQACVSCNRSLAMLPVGQVVRCSRCTHLMCTICSRTCTSLPPSSSSLPPSQHTLLQQKERDPSRRTVRKLPRRGKRGGPFHVVLAPVSKPGVVDVVSMDCSMEDLTESPGLCPDGTMLPYSHVHRRHSSGSGSDEERKAVGWKTEKGDKEDGREGCGRVVCKACCVEDVRRGTLGCLDCLS